MRRRLRYILGTIVAGVLLVTAGGVAFIYSGIYNIGASGPHLAPFEWAITTLKVNSVRRHARGIQAPSLRDPALVQRGLALYLDKCLVCHGAPGVGREQIGWGINPNPPLLYVEARHWSDAELYWIIAHGLKMAGMPGYGPGLHERDLWSLVAFTRRLPELSMDQFSRMADAVTAGAAAEPVEWLSGNEGGFAAMLAGGSARRGRDLLERYGCGSCHGIPGVRGARGYTGPPLDLWAERHFIAGSLLNTPANLVAFIMDPQAAEPGTVMPDLGVTREEALDMAAYLFTLGEPPLALHTVLERNTRRED